MTEFESNPKTSRKTVFFCTNRRLHKQNVVHLGDHDSPCYRSEDGARAFEVPWGQWDGRATVVAVETNDAMAFSDRAEEGTVVYAQIMKPPSRYLTQVWANMYNAPDAEWLRDVAEPFGLLSPV